MLLVIQIESIPSELTCFFNSKLVQFVQTTLRVETVVMHRRNHFHIAATFTRHEIKMFRQRRRCYVSKLGRDFESNEEPFPCCIWQGCSI